MSARGPSDAALLAALEDARAAQDVTARVARDPVSIVHRYQDRLDVELVALIASACAFGNVTTILAKVDDALQRLGPRPAYLPRGRRAVERALEGFRHRLFRGEDLAALVVGVRVVQRAHGSLGAAFALDLAECGGDLQEALARLVDLIRKGGKFPPRGARGGRRGASHLLPDVRGGAASKRLMLFLRWMVRPADGVDLGQWPVDRSLLVMPLDTHIHRLAQNLGLTQRRDASWRTALEITGRLRRLDPSDPVRFDFALCHLGMAQGCPSRRDAVRCEGCGVRPVCRHWLR